MKRLRTLITRPLRQLGEAAAQEERNRLARDLHDSIKQQLFSINVSTAAAQERWEMDPAGARAALADVRRSAREAMVEMQALLHQLRPQALSSTAGLIGALREQCEALGYRTGAKVSLEIGPEIPDERMPGGAREALFRISQEALANVARHARAGIVRLWIGREGEAAVLRIDDDGQGFKPGAASAGMGLRNLRERAEAHRGSVSIASAPGAGARVVIRIPLDRLPAQGRPAVLVDFGELAWNLWMLSLFIVTFGKKLVLGSYLDLIFVLTFPVAWWLGRHNSAPSLQHRRNAMVGLWMSWVFWSMVKGAPSPWPFFMYLLTFVLWIGLYLVRFHRVTDFRRVWSAGERIGVGLLIVEVLGTVAIQRLAALKFGGLVLTPFESVLYLINLAVFAYLVTRQPRELGSLA